MGIVDGRIALVTGGAQGLGLAICKRLLAEGARVVAADIQDAKLKAAYAGEANGPDQILTCTANVRDDDSVQNLVDTTVRHFGGIDVLINVAGGSGNESVFKIEDLSYELWNQVVDLNLNGTFRCCRAAAPHLRHRGAKIINFSSGSLRGVGPKSTVAARHAYAAAKAGIHGLTNQLAMDMGQDGAIAYAVVPGFILTEPGARLRQIFDNLDPETREAMVARMAQDPRQPEDMGWAVTYLASERASDLNGAAIRLAGPIDSVDLELSAPQKTSIGQLAEVRQRHGQ